MKTGRNDPCSCGSGRKRKRCCEAGTAVASKPREADRLHSGALLEVRAGHFEQAVELLRQAIALAPAMASCHNNLGCALQALGRREEALAAYREAIRLEPGYVDALSNLGRVLFESGRSPEALPHLEKAVALQPTHTTGNLNLILTLHALDRSGEGLCYAEKAMAMPASCRAGIEQCARALLSAECWAEARPFAERWVMLDPENAMAYKSLGDSYAMQSLPQEALLYYYKALDLAPDSSEVANNLGSCLTDRGGQAEALALCRRAVDLRPDYPDAWSNLGMILKNLGKPETTLRCLEMALSLDPGHVQANWNRSVCLLSLGRLAEGWAAHEWGWKTGQRAPSRPFTHPVWDGSDLAGKTILVSMEQGVGDHILFASMLPDLAAAGARCIVECDRRLVELFERSFPATEAFPMTDPPHPRAQSPEIDFQIRGGSLPRWLRPTLAHFPQRRGYLTPAPARAAFWRDRLHALGEGLKVGICWRSMYNRGGFERYSTKLLQWGPILTTPGVHFINLQYDDCARELRQAESAFGVPIHVWEGMDLKGDLDGVAALISGLDLVITTSTSVHEMGGAVGVPVWLLTDDTHERLLGTTYCPWYPTVRTFCNAAYEPWEPVIQKLAAELAGMAETGLPAPVFSLSLPGPSSSGELLPISEAR